MIPSPAQYLLRFDDLCPTAPKANWARFREIVDEFGVKPILAVIPENRDSDFTLENPDPNFWQTMRSMQAHGASIALHGYQHICDSMHGGLIPLHRKTEFAGVPLTTQRRWIQEGLRILREQGLNPSVFVAPRHGFDKNTLHALSAEGIGSISDGFARVPFKRDGVMWIPQQLWSPVLKPAGLWTICIHTNTAGQSLAKRLRTFLAVHANQFTTLDRVLAEFKPGPLSVRERVYEIYATRRVVMSRRWKRLARKHATGV